MMIRASNAAKSEGANNSHCWRVINQKEIFSCVYEDRGSQVKKIVSLVYEDDYVFLKKRVIKIFLKFHTLLFLSHPLTV